MEKEIGDYIRTKQGYIAKVISQDVYIELDKPVDFKQTSGTHYAGQILFDEDDIEIAKHSKNIIDLIEVGDYVNGYKVVKDNLESAEYGKYVDVYCPSKNLELNFMEHVFKNQIKTILTHEQYEQNCYKVGED